jgi:hypothetical protein
MKSKRRGGKNQELRIKNQEPRQKKSTAALTEIFVKRSFKRIAG